MSHFTRVATKINHLPALRTALESLSLPCVEGEAVHVRGYIHEQITAKMVIQFEKYDLAVVPSDNFAADGTYEFAADWWGLETTTGRTEREIVDEICREYAVARVTIACTEAGYELAPVEVGEDGSVTLVARPRSAVDWSG